MEPRLLTPLPSTLYAPEDLPAAFDWRNVSTGLTGGSGETFQSLVTIPRNQHIPREFCHAPTSLSRSRMSLTRAAVGAHAPTLLQHLSVSLTRAAVGFAEYCGSCWAHAATSSLSDRLLIAHKGTKQQINLAPQYLLNCGNDSSIGRDVGSCHGGSSIRSFEYIAKHGIVDETCCPYQAKDLFTHSKDETCVPDMICRNCDHTGCWAVPQGHGGAGTHRRAYVTEYGPAKGVHAMMAEVFARGPIACSINASNPSFEGLHYAGYNSQVRGGKNPIFVDKNTKENHDTTHVVSVAGWGHDEETELDYWVVRNSWGTYWGLGGTQAAIIIICLYMHYIYMPAIDRSLFACRLVLHRARAECPPH